MKKRENSIGEFEKRKSKQSFGNKVKKREGGEGKLVRESELHKLVVPESSEIAKSFQQSERKLRSGRGKGEGEETKNLQKSERTKLTIPL